MIIASGGRTMAEMFPRFNWQIFSIPGGAAAFLKKHALRSSSAEKM